MRMKLVERSVRVSMAWPYESTMVSISQSPKRLPSASAGRSWMPVRLAIFVALVGRCALHGGCTSIHGAYARRASPSCRRGHGCRWSACRHVSPLSEHSGYLGGRPILLYHAVDAPPQLLRLAVVALETVLAAVTLDLSLFPHIAAVRFRVALYLAADR